MTASYSRCLPGMLIADLTFLNVARIACQLSGLQTKLPKASLTADI